MRGRDAIPRGRAGTGIPEGWVSWHPDPLHGSATHEHVISPARRKIVCEELALDCGFDSLADMKRAVTKALMWASR